MKTDVDEVLRQMQERWSSPEAQAKMAAEDAARRKEIAAELRGKRRRAIEAMGLAAKDLEILRGETIRETDAMGAIAVDVPLTVLSGAPGCGKTVAAAAWLFRWVQDDASWTDGDGWKTPEFIGRGLWLTAAKLARWPKYDTDAMDRLLRCTRLVVDDLGTEYLDEKGSYLSLLDEVINERYSQRRLTVMTTNLDASQFRERYGERISDRIREAGRFVSVDSASMRRKTTPNGVSAR